MKTRLKNVFTTVLGLLILAGCGVFVYRGSATLTEVSGFATIGLALILSKDMEFAKNFLPFLFNQHPASSTTNTCESCGQTTTPTDENTH